MTIEIKKIIKDLEGIIQNCSEKAGNVKELDPLLEIYFAFKIESVTQNEMKGSLVIDRNSGGSPESDYAIQDEVFINISIGNRIKIVFNLEMMEIKRLELVNPVQSEWDAVLKEIEAFCLQTLPKPMGDIDY